MYKQPKTKTTCPRTIHTVVEIPMIEVVLNYTGLQRLEDVGLEIQVDAFMI